MLDRRRLLLLTPALLAGGLALPGTAEAQRGGVWVELPPPPPPPRARRPGRPRRGYAWVPGHWRWNGRRYVWVEGEWVRARRGHRYAEPRWEPEGRRWRYVPGEWVRDR